MTNTGDAVNKIISTENLKCIEQDTLGSHSHPGNFTPAIDNPKPKLMLNESTICMIFIQMSQSTTASAVKDYMHSITTIHLNNTITLAVVYPGFEEGRC